MNRHENESDWSDDPPKLSERELLEWCAGISDRAAAKLQRLQFAEAEAKAKARQDRELLEFVAAITGKPEHQRQLRELIQKEADEREASRREEAFHERYVADVTEWNPNQLRIPAGSPQGGQWAKGGGGAGAGRSEPAGELLFAQADGAGTPPVNVPSEPGGVGHHYIPVATSEKLAAEGILEPDEFAYFGGRSSGPLSAGHPNLNSAEQRAYSVAVEKELREWKAAEKAGKTKLTAADVAKHIKAGKSWNGAEGPEQIRSFNEKIAAHTINPNYDVADRATAVARGKAQARVRKILGRISSVLGVLGAAGQIAQGGEIANILQNGEGMKCALAAAEKGNAQDAENALIGVGFPKPSVYEELLAVDPKFALAFRKAVERAHIRER